MRSQYLPAQSEPFEHPLQKLFLFLRVRDISFTVLGKILYQFFPGLKIF